MHTHPYEPYLYERLRLSLQILEINTVTTGALLSTGTLTTAERTVSAQSRSKFKNYEHKCQVENSNSNG
jgi:hypothetical protein